MSDCCCIIMQGRGLHHSCFEPRRSPAAAPFPSTSPPTPPAPIHLSRVSTASRRVTRVFRRAAENSLPPPSAARRLHPPPPPASVVCCFHRKLARRPPRWIPCIARYLPVKVFNSSCRLHLLLSPPRPPHPRSAPPPPHHPLCLTPPPALSQK